MSVMDPYFFLFLFKRLAIELLDTKKEAGRIEEYSVV